MNATSGESTTSDEFALMNCPNETRRKVLFRAEVTHSVIASVYKAGMSKKWASGY
jgi:hypothetical protein